MADRPSGATDFASGTSLVSAPSDSQIKSGLPAAQPSVNLFNGIFRRLFRWVDFLGAREHPRYGGLNIDWVAARPRVKLPFEFGADTPQEDKAAEIEVFYIKSASRAQISSRRELSFIPTPGRPLIKEVSWVLTPRAVTLNIPALSRTPVSSFPNDQYSAKTLTGRTGTAADVKGADSWPSAWPDPDASQNFIEYFRTLQGDPGQFVVPKNPKFPNSSTYFEQIVNQLLGLRLPDNLADVNYRTQSILFSNAWVWSGGSFLWDLLNQGIGGSSRSGRIMLLYSDDRRSYIYRRLPRLNRSVGGLARPWMPGDHEYASSLDDTRSSGDPANISKLLIVDSASERTVQTQRGTVYAPSSAASIPGAAFRLARLEYVPRNPDATANTVTITPMPLGQTITYQPNPASPSSRTTTPNGWKAYSRYPLWERGSISPNPATDPTSPPWLEAIGVQGSSSGSIFDQDAVFIQQKYQGLYSLGQRFLRKLEYKGVQYDLSSFSPFSGLSDPDVRVHLGRNRYGSFQRYALPLALKRLLLADTTWPQLRFQDVNGNWYPAETNAHKLELTFAGTIAQTTFDTVLLIDGQGGQIRSLARSAAAYDASAKKFTWTGDFADPSNVRQIAFLKLGSSIQADVLQRIAASNYNIQRLANKDFLTFADEYTLPSNKLFIKKA